MELSNLPKAFSALALESRLAVLRLLIEAGPPGMQAGVLAAKANLPPPTLSFHLKELLAAGLVTSRREGRNVIYAPDYAGIRGMITGLLSDCCQGDPRLCGPYVVAPKARESA